MGFLEVWGEVVGGDGLAFGEDGGAFDDVGEFADIAWVGVVFEEFDGLVGEADEVAVEFFGLLIEEVVGQIEEIGGALSEWGDFYLDDIDSVVEVLSEVA